MAKLGVEPEHLRGVPLEYLMWIELSDGQWENMEDPVDEVVNHRRLPGEGQFPIREYVQVCQEMGYDKPWGVEVLSEALRALPIEEEFKRSYEATAAQFSAAVA
jgi:sugar phosphate isomerase/epimerase